MPRRIKQTKPILPSLMSNFIGRLSDSNNRLRKKLLKYGYIALAVFFIYSAVSPTFGIQRIIFLELEKETLKDSNREELVKLIDAERIRNLLKTSDSYIEYLARTRYHMIYPGETIYRYYGQ